MKPLKSITLFVTSLFVTLFICDFFIAKSEIENPTLNELDTIVGRKRRPNLNYTMFNEGFSMGKFNSYSYLGPNYHPRKEKNIFRIALLGDSFVEGFQVFDDFHFRNIIEAKLNKAMNREVQVLNFGRSGFDLADIYVYLERFVKDFNPDLTLIFISNPDLECNQTDQAIPRLNFNGNSLEIINTINDDSGSDMQSILYKSLKYSRLLQMTNSCRKLIKQGYFLPKIFDKLYITDLEDFNPESMKPIILSEEVFEINRSLAKYPENNIWILNRGDDQLENEYVLSLKENGIMFLDINDTLNVLRGVGVDINYWNATKKHGHWNMETHNAVGNFIANKIIQKEY
jgi:hypothetical protein